MKATNLWTLRTTDKRIMIIKKTERVMSLSDIKVSLNHKTIITWKSQKVIYSVWRQQSVVHLPEDTENITQFVHPVFHFSSTTLDVKWQKPVEGVISCNNFTLEQATEAQMRSRCIALLFLQPRLKKGVSGQRHSSAALPPGKRPFV